VREYGATARGFGYLTAAAIGLTLAVPAARPASVGQSGEPQVGDMIVVGGTPVSRALRDVRLLVHRPHQYACVLNFAVLGQNAGSLIVEATAPWHLRAMRLHWAGRRTSDDAADCGRSADLILDQAEVRLLLRMQQD
jgi:hypothetical protein